MHNKSSNVGSFDVRGVLAIQVIKFLKKRDIDLGTIMQTMDALNKIQPKFKESVEKSTTLIREIVKQKLGALWDNAIFDVGGKGSGQIKWASMVAGVCKVTTTRTRGAKRTKVQRTCNVTVKNWPETLPMTGNYSSAQWKTLAATVDVVTITLTARST
jgi:hypothetical protein